MIQGSTSIALSSVNDNILTGSQFEFVTRPYFIEFGLNGDANGADLRIDVYSGQDLLAESLTPNVQNRMPVYPDDYTLQDVAGPPDRLKIRVRNLSAAAARTIFFGVRLTPV
jgi:hypothetical protein